jgi:hypothetical protein
MWGSFREREFVAFLCNWVKVGVDSDFDIKVKVNIIVKNNYFVLKWF